MNVISRGWLRFHSQPISVESLWTYIVKPSSSSVSNVWSDLYLWYEVLTLSRICCLLFCFYLYLFLFFFSFVRSLSSWIMYLCYILTRLRDSEKFRKRNDNKKKYEINGWSGYVRTKIILKYLFLSRERRKRYRNGSKQLLNGWYSRKSMNIHLLCIVVLSVQCKNTNASPGPDTMRDERAQDVLFLCLFPPFLFLSLLSMFSFCFFL